MQYVGRAIGSVSKTWNSINPATLSGAIDVIVIEQENGDLNCSPFHVRFGKFSLLRPSQKKVDFTVNGEKTDLPMKLGEGGEAFFVFETDSSVPRDLRTSPVISPASSGPSSPATPEASSGLQEPEFLDLSRSRSESPEPKRKEEQFMKTPSSTFPLASLQQSNEFTNSSPTLLTRSRSPTLSREQAVERAKELSRKLTDVNIPSKISDNGDVVLDMTGYKSGEEEIKESEQVVRRILIEEFGIESDDIDSMIGADDEGNLRIYSREDMLTGYSSDDQRLHSKVGGAYSSDSEASESDDDGQKKSYHAKTLRLTSDQLKSLKLHHGANEIAFSVNGGRAVCSARMFYWKHDAPIVISDIDGTITKSDALGHVLTMLGRDWTHDGVAKLFTDIGNNGYNVMYLTARSVGQADSTRAYLKGISQEGHKLPQGPVILSPDRTMAALRREVIMRKPEVFKMACLRDIQSLFGEREETPFFAGFGNRITDALSYRSVGVPSSRIFTINSNSDVHMELLELAGYKSSYIYIADLVDHFFPPVLESIKVDEPYTDVNFWREPIPDISDLESLNNDHDEPRRGRSPTVSSAAVVSTSLSPKKSNPQLEAAPEGEEDYDDDEEEEDEDYYDESESESESDYDENEGEYEDDEYAEDEREEDEEDEEESTKVMKAVNLRDSPSQ
ncbi:phosphatidic acid phosphohydrolase 1 [Trichomonascus vanleenenianus]|uniref:phosphatidate phosphatase PAH1 n=1 Tax=Trichomonascus vanleenenianus TaxID=2268995 RepID=UPI003ECA0AEB